MGGTVQRFCSRELAVPVRDAGGKGPENRAPFASLFWSSFSNVITNSFSNCALSLHFWISHGLKTEEQMSGRIRLYSLAKS